jgi:hypothetical protein
LEPKDKLANPFFSFADQLMPLDLLDANVMSMFSNLLRTMLVKINYLSLFPTT